MWGAYEDKLFVLWNLPQNVPTKKPHPDAADEVFDKTRCGGVVFVVVFNHVFFDVCYFEFVKRTNANSVLSHDLFFSYHIFNLTVTKEPFIKALL